MKDIKCPLCGGNPEYILDEGDGHCEYAGCPKCGLYAAPSWGDWNCNPNEEDTWQRWRDLVSKFPSIMRVQVGDSITHISRYGERISYAQIHGINRDKCIIKTSRGVCTPDDVLKWPWELEQKGGTEQ